MYFSFHPDESVLFPMLVLLPSGVLKSSFRTYVHCESHIERQGCVKPDLPKCRNPASQRFQYTDGAYVVFGAFMFDDNATVVDCHFSCKKDVVDMARYCCRRSSYYTSCKLFVLFRMEKAEATRGEQKTTRATI
ncbi:hypothetical protein AAG906_023684 [Vitis piasezkii]